MISKTIELTVELLNRTFSSPSAHRILVLPGYCTQGQLKASDRAALATSPYDHLQIKRLSGISMTLCDP